MPEMADAPFDCGKHFFALYTVASTYNVRICLKCGQP